MKYISTRGSNRGGVSSAYAIKTGLADDGGLFMPEIIPTVDIEFIKEISALSYHERAAKILSLFLDDYSYDELLEDTMGAYTGNKFIPSPAPITKLSQNKYMLELWHGPTCAFKDMALQLMPRLFTRALKKCGEDRTALILVATSGDTGKAALEGYRDIEQTKIQVFYPSRGVSQVQKRQMQTQEGKNLYVAGIEGNFDDAQSGVKAIFSDKEIRDRLNDYSIFLSSANSINWGRLVPQIVYYFSAYCDMYRSGAITPGDRIDVCVPTGNFGNIFACYLAKKMGLPVDKLICASNKNNILTDFITDGIYDRNRDFYSTMSPSMDILISSNLERLLYTLFGSERCAELMKELNENGKYALTESELTALQNDFIGYYTDEDECASTIKRVYENENRLVDTHTAVAISAAERYMDDHKARSAMLVVSTASAYKFAADVLLSLTGNKPENDLDAPTILNELTEVEIPSPLLDAISKEPIHTDIYGKNKSDMTDAVFRFVTK